MTRDAVDTYRVACPPADGLARWPADWGTRFTLFVDTEEEFDWSAPVSRTARAVTAIGALPAAHARLIARGVEAVYLVDHPVATDPQATALIRETIALGHAEIGAQLHPWVNPPFAGDDDKEESFPGNLPAEVEAAKLDALIAAIAGSFGQAPIAYRAGRYGLGPRTIDLLASRGFRVDVSMRAAYDYSGEGGPDYSCVGAWPFHTGPGGAILELPPTSVFTGRLRRWGAALHRRAGRVPHGRGVLARAGLVSRVALTPEDMPVGEVLDAIRRAVDDRLPLLSLSFHSPSLVPGNTPYVRDAADLRAFWRWWDAVLDLLDRRGVRAASLEAVLAAVR